MNSAVICCLYVRNIIWHFEIGKYPNCPPCSQGSSNVSFNDTCKSILVKCVNSRLAWLVTDKPDVIFKGISWKKGLLFWLKFHGSLPPEIHLMVLQIMARRLFGTKPLSEPLVASFTAACIRPSAFAVMLTNITFVSSLNNNAIRVTGFIYNAVMQSMYPTIPCDM